MIDKNIFCAFVNRFFYYQLQFLTDFTDFHKQSTDKHNIMKIRAKFHENPW